MRKKIDGSLLVAVVILSFILVMGNLYSKHKTSWEFRKVGSVESFFPKEDSVEVSLHTGEVLILPLRKTSVDYSSDSTQNLYMKVPNSARELSEEAFIKAIQNNSYSVACEFFNYYTTIDF